MQVTSRSTLLAVALCTFLFFATSPQAAAQVQFGGQAPGLVIYDFEDYAQYSSGQGTAFVTIRDDVHGVTFGERLVGQIASSIDTFDVISGLPVSPLTMDESIDASFGVNILKFRDTIIDGLGPVGFPTPEAIGDGALTVLFDQNQAVVAFDVVGANGGPMTLQFFSRYGGLIDTVEVAIVASDTYVFSSEAGNIAAVTITNMDWGGLGYDNFTFASGNMGPAGSCSVGGPFFVDAQDEFAFVDLDGRLEDDPNGNLNGYFWVSDCPGASFGSKTAAQTTLEVQPEGPCTTTCTVTLLVDDGEFVDVCSATVTIEGEGGSTGGGSLSCPEDMTVESDGNGNVAQLTDWLASVDSDSETVVDDFTGMTYACGTSGSVEVTWADTAAGGGDCGGANECSAAFTIVDTDGPALFVGAGSVVVENVDCTAAVSFELPPAIAVDTADGSVAVTNDAPDYFPAGETTVVTYTATDTCGNTASTTVEVSVPHSAGVAVEVLEQVTTRGQRGTPSLAMPNVVVLAFDVGSGGCVRDADGHDQGISSNDYAAIVSDCSPAGSATTDANGYAEIGLPEGHYVLIAPIDTDGDGEADELLGVPTGQIKCGHWKTRRLSF